MLNDTDLTKEAGKTTSAGLAEAALYYLFAQARELEPTADQRSFPLDGAERQLSIALVGLGVPEVDADAVPVLIRTARIGMRDGLDRTLRTSDYDRERVRALARFGVTTVKGQESWPQTVRTTANALDAEGKWAAAVRSVGLESGKPGRAPGTTSWSDEHLVSAMTAFMAQVRSTGDAPTVTAYDLWLAEQKEDGSEVPSVTSIINRLGGGSWRAAVADATPKSVLAEPTEEPTSLVLAAQEDMVGVQRDFADRLLAEVLDKRRTVDLADAQAVESLAWLSTAFVTIDMAARAGELQLEAEKRKELADSLTLTRTVNAALVAQNRREAEAAEVKKKQFIFDVGLAVAIVLSSLVGPVLGLFLGN